MSTQLDRRAEAAAAAVRAAVADLGPELDGTVRSARRRWPAAVAAAALLVGGVGGTALLRDDDGQHVVAGTTGEGTMPHLVVDDPPQGLRPTGAAEVLDDDPGRTLRLELYGRGDTDDPFADGDVALLTAPVGWTPSQEGRPLQVRGHDGRMSTDPSPGLRSLQWDEPTVGLVSLMTRSLSDEHLLDVAGRLRRSGQELEVVPPDGYEPVADLDQFPGVGAVVNIGGGVRGAFASYQDEGGERLLAVGSRPEQPGLLDAYRWFGGPQSRPVDVGDHDGWLLHAEEDIVTVVWQERPGVVVDVGGVGLSDEEVLRAAESLRPATDAEWAALLAQGAQDEPMTGEAPTLASGSRWRYTADAEDGVCFEVTVEDDSTTSCGPDVPALYEGAEGTEDGWWVHGRVPLAVRRVVVETGTGAAFEAEVVDMAGEGGRAWARALPRSVGPVTVVAIAEDGTEVDRASGVPSDGPDGGSPAATTIP